MKIGQAVIVLWSFKDNRCPSEISWQTATFGVKLNRSPWKQIRKER